ncbi:MAG TPA: hypothetical protein VFV95_08640 [Vicinamibacterales bacterium]|nr:hypothetical protein [Vicinamibacterales bacterium]
MRITVSSGIMAGTASFAIASSRRSIIEGRRLHTIHEQLAADPFNAGGRRQRKLPDMGREEQRAEGDPQSRTAHRVSRQSGHRRDALSVDRCRRSAGTRQRRGYIERNSIALLSNFGKTPLDAASLNWRGRGCVRGESKVRDSGMWNQRHVEEDYDSAFLDVLTDLVDRT